MNDTIADSLSSLLCEATDTLLNDVTMAANESIATGNDTSIINWMEHHNVLVSVFIFVVGWVLTVIIAKIGERIKRNNFKNVVLDWIELTAPTEKKLSQSLKDLAEEMKTTDEMLPLPYGMPLTIPDRIKDMSVERMMDSFVAGWYTKEKRKKRSTNMYNIISQFEYLTRVSGEILKTYNSYNGQTYAQVQMWNKINNRLWQMLVNYKSEGIKSIINKFDDAYKLSPNSLKIRKEFVESLYGTLGLGNVEISLLQRMNQVLNQIEAFQGKFAIVFNNQAKAIEDSVNSLTKAKYYFRKKNKFDYSDE